MLRRHFLQTACAFGLFPCFSRFCVPQGFQPYRIAVLSDIHIAPDSRQREELKKRIETILQAPVLPDRLLIFGDLSLEHGNKEDYQTVRKLLTPLENAGIVWDAVFGNHDCRENFFTVFPEKEPASFEVPGKWTSVVPTPFVDFILLDSLVPGQVAGAIDDIQKEWLDAKMAASTKPFFVGAHHPINETLLASLLSKYPLCAGYLHGHAHVWEAANDGGVSTLCFPSAGGWGEIGQSLLTLSPQQGVFDVALYDYYPPRFNPDEPRLPEWIAEVNRKNGSSVAIPLPTAVY